MKLEVTWQPKVASNFPELAISIGAIKNVKVEKTNMEIQELKNALYAEAKAKHNIESLRENHVVRAYRDFYWKLGVDPTKIRPSGEALLRRVLHSGEFPAISTAVDAYNLASLKTIIPISGFNMDTLNPPFNVRYAENGEPFIGIGMEKPYTLKDNMLVLADMEKVLSIYPYRDCEHTKITEKTGNILIVGYGAPGIASHQLEEAVKTALNYIKKVCGGEIETAKVYSLHSLS